MRLSRGRDIRRVFRAGLSISNPLVVVRAFRRGGDSAPRIAFALARRHVPSAVRRNRAKRIMRESFRRHAPSLRGFDIVIVSRSTLDGAGGRELRQEMDRQWSRLVAVTEREGGSELSSANGLFPRSGAKSARPVD